jgi:hypothetical protein
MCTQAVPIEVVSTSGEVSPANADCAKQVGLRVGGSGSSLRGQGLLYFFFYTPWAAEDAVPLHRRWLVSRSLCFTAGGPGRRAWGWSWGPAAMLWVAGRAGPVAPGRERAPDREQPAYVLRVAGGLQQSGGREQR